MNPYSLQLLATTLCSERIAQANAARRVAALRHGPKRPRIPAAPGAATPSTAPVCSTA